MITTIIANDSSDKFLIPKLLLEKSGLAGTAMVEAKKGEIRIISARSRSIDEDATLSEKILAVDWNKPEEDKAWMNLK